MTSYSSSSAFSGSSTQQSITQKIDNIILDCYLKSADILIPGRNAYTIPKIRDPLIERYSDVSDYCRQALRYWVGNVTLPLTIDISYIDPATQIHVLIEKWVFTYYRKESAQEPRANVAQFKILTFLRTLYSSVRLLPGFQLLLTTKTLSAISFQIYNPDSVESAKFSVEPTQQEFPRVSTAKGVLSVTVKYVEAAYLQQLLGTPIFFLLKYRNPTQRVSMSSATTSKAQNYTNSNLNQGGSSRRNSQVQMQQQQDGTVESSVDGNKISPSSKISFTGFPARSDGQYSTSVSPPQGNTQKPIRGVPIKSESIKKLSPTDSSPMSYSPSLPVPTFLLDTAAQVGINKGMTVGSWGESSPIVDPRLLAIPQLPAIEDGEANSISPPFSHFTAALLSTSPQIGGSLMNLMQSLRGPGAQALVVKSQSHEAKLASLPPSPFDINATTADIKTSTRNDPINQQGGVSLGIEQKSMNKFIKDVLYRNRNGISLYTMSASNDDDEDDDEFVQPFSMAFASQTTSSTDPFTNSEENYSRIVPLKYKSVNKTAEVSSTTGILMELIGGESRNASIDEISPRLKTGFK